MASQKDIETYLLENTEERKGYLLDPTNNGKVVMLSGVWGCGKTYFWQDKVIPFLNEGKNKIPNHYISLYGKTSISEIKNEIFIKVFESVDSFDLKEKALVLTKSTINLASSLSGILNIFGISEGLSKITNESFDSLGKLLDDEKLKKTKAYLNSGAIICFDDFERKSKDIDLNDLFGFITQLTLNFNCKIVIILNGDAFEGKEKDVFSNVKEKTVSKFLNYKPKIEELFNLIFDEKYKKLMQFKSIILNTIRNTEELNARIYIQVLDNLLEWLVNNDEEYKEEVYIKYLILQNINFILNHCIVVINKKTERKMGIIKDELYSLEYISTGNYKKDDCQKVINFISNHNIYTYTKGRNIEKELIEDNIILNVNEINALYFSRILGCYTFSSVENNTFYDSTNREIYEKINNFIETGILIKDEEK